MESFKEARTDSRASIDSRWVSLLYPIVIKYLSIRIQRSYVALRNKEKLP